MTREESDFVLCSKDSYFIDDKTAVCNRCKCVVFFRPHAPIPLVGYMCSECGLSEAKKNGAKIVTTKKALLEAKEYLERRN